jgi:hypothetical protein
MYDILAVLGVTLAHSLYVPLRMDLVQFRTDLVQFRKDLVQFRADLVHFAQI